ncbi:MAG: undecaprenyl-phosphate glucose phosphotransferase [Lachnospiraceae bacterium]|nr:undecaprenyl-phosphate glucose phosphotransferase [Lachnospiraceae bacterium]
MIRDNQTQMNRLRFVLDALTVTGAYYFTYFLFFFVLSADGIFGGHFSYHVQSRDYLLAVLYILPLHLIVYALLHLYRPMRVTGRRVEAFRIFLADLISVLLVIVIFWLFVKNYSAGFSRMFLFEFGVINTFAMVLQRNLVRLVMMNIRRRGLNQKHLLLVGYSRSAERLLDCMKRNPQWGYDVYGVLDDEKPEGYDYHGFKIIGTVDRLTEILAGNFIDEVFVTLRLKDYERLEEIVQACEKAGIQTKFVPDYGNLMSNRPYTEELAGLPIIYIRQVPLNDMMNAFLKRSMDIFGSLFALALFAPLMLIVAFIVRVTSKGPVIFKQERVGLHNKNFMMFKFRSMRMQRDEDEVKEWTTKNDPRVTWIGKIIRKTSIDELPQLFNVLSGKMSLIGPRPERPQFVEKFKEEIPRYMVKHQVRPGMTGWAQVNGLRGDTSIEERIEHDIYYIENWSLGLDLKILILTFFKGFVNKNAY